MTRHRLKFMAVLVVALSLATSACFQIRGFNIGPKGLTPGATAKVKVILTPYGTDFGSDGKVALLIGLLDLDFRGISNFDKKGAWGGPYTVSNNNSLRNRMLTPGVCGGLGFDAADITGMDEWRAYATNDNVDSTGLTAADLNKKFRVVLSVDRAAGTDDGTAGTVILISAFWQDGNGNNVWDASELVVCTGMVASSVSFVAP